MEKEYARELHEQLIALGSAHERSQPAETAAMLKALRQWRAARMQATYGDLYQAPRYRPAVDFLVNDLFGTDKLGVRASQLRQAESAMVKVMPDTLLGLTAKAVHLTALTVELDVILAEQMKNSQAGAEGVAGDVVAESLRLYGDYQRYKQQVNLVESVGGEIDTAVHKPFVAMALRMCRKPAHLMGLADLQDFLERGFAAFKNMRGAGEFLATFKKREMTILDKVFSGRENPFEFEG